MSQQGTAAGALQYDLVSDLTLPGDAANTTEETHVKTFKFSFFFLLHARWSVFQVHCHLHILLNIALPFCLLRQCKLDSLLCLAVPEVVFSFPM